MFAVYSIKKRIIIGTAPISDLPSENRHHVENKKGIAGIKLDGLNI